METTPKSIPGTIALVGLRIFGCFFLALGLFGSVLRWTLPQLLPHTALHVAVSFALFFCGALVGLAVLFRFRWAAILLSATYAFIGYVAVSNAADGMFPSELSPASVAWLMALALLPAFLTVVAWQQLRWWRAKG